MYEGRKVYAIVLAAGSGRRMHSKQKKQFMEILGNRSIHGAQNSSILILR